MNVVNIAFGTVNPFRRVPGDLTDSDAKFQIKRTGRSFACDNQPQESCIGVFLRLEGLRARARHSARELATKFVPEETLRIWFSSRTPCASPGGLPQEAVEGFRRRG